MNHPLPIAKTRSPIPPTSISASISAESDPVLASLLCDLAQSWAAGEGDRCDKYRRAIALRGANAANGGRS